MPPPPQPTPVKPKAAAPAADKKSAPKEEPMKAPSRGYGGWFVVLGMGRGFGI